MRVINVKRTAPKLVQRFENLLWVNTPLCWQFHSLYHQNRLYVTIIIDPDEETSKIQREYLGKDIKKRSDDIWGLASDCAQEIIHAIEQV